MAVDLSVFDKQKTVLDQQALQEAFNFKKALAVQAAQKDALEMQALQAQAANGGLTLKDMLTMQMQKENQKENRELRRESMDIQRQNALANMDLRRDALNERIDAKQEKINAKQEKMNIAKQGFEDSLAEMAMQYNKLKEGGGVSSINDSGLSNFITGMQTSTVGQGTGSLLGTKNQSARNEIAANIPLLTNAVKEATGMSAQQMNSNVELQTFLKALGNTKNDYESNMNILANLSRRFGTGEVAKSLGGKSGNLNNQPAQPVTLSTDNEITDADIAEYKKLRGIQ